MIIVTRPSPYGEQLTQLCQQANLPVRHLPFFNILKGPDLDQLQHHLQQLNQSDIVIVVSPQVGLIIQSNTQKIIFPDNVCYFAVGQKTAQQFAQICQQPVDYPAVSENSEGLLEHFAKNKMLFKQRQVLILCGDTGRTVINDTLTAQGALVKYIHCYQRQTIDYPASIFDDHSYYLFVITSVEHLLQLDKYCTDKQKQYCDIIVSSLRTLEQAKLLDWQHIHLVTNANNQNLFKTIATLCHNATII